MIPIPEITTQETADQIFSRWAIVNLIRRREAAQLKVKLAELTKTAEERIKPIADEEAALSAALSEYIRLHPEAFQTPRKRKLALGSYGLQSSQAVELDSDFDADGESDRLGIELCHREITPDLDLIRAALAAGEEVKGARLVSLEKVVLTVDKKANPEDVTHE